MALARSEYLVHLVVGSTYALGFLIEQETRLSQVHSALGMARVFAISCRLLAGFRNEQWDSPIGDVRGIGYGGSFQILLRQTAHYAVSHFDV